MTPPLHVAPIGAILPPDYFSPGVSIMHGEICASPWAVAFWQGQSFRYERPTYGAEWVRIS